MSKWVPAADSQSRKTSLQETSSGAVVPNLFCTRDQFCGRQFFHGLGEGVDGFRIIQACYIYYATLFILLLPYNM